MKQLQMPWTQTFLKRPTHITNSKEARTQWRQAILDEDEYGNVYVL